MDTAVASFSEGDFVSFRGRAWKVSTIGSNRFGHEVVTLRSGKHAFCARTDHIVHLSEFARKPDPLHVLAFEEPHAA